jgi:hypothetical protein
MLRKVPPIRPLHPLLPSAGGLLATASKPYLKGKAPPLNKTALRKRKTLSPPNPKNLVKK